jgi:hypothetical protein
MAKSKSTAKEKTQKARFSEERAGSLAQFIEVVFKIRDAWDDASDDLIDPWFRGQSSIDYELVPSYFRHKPAKDDETEDDLRLDFQQKATPLLTEAAPLDDWEWYFLMQHYGLPTRLLDWSESALVGVFFAVAESASGSDAAVWMLDPWRLNVHSPGDG